jgi:hypothetical protein
MIASLLARYQLEYRNADQENIPLVVCNDWQEFSQLVEAFNHIPDAQFVFRGQRRNDWKLTPGLARFFDKVNPSDKKGIVQEEHAMAQLELFRKSIRGRVNDYALFDDDHSQDAELWSIGQHFGLDTPLLDWTHSPYVALYFAFEKPDRFGEPDNPWRCVYVMNKQLVEKLSFQAEQKRILFIEPRKDDQGRLVSQAGLFTQSPYGETLENAILNALSSELADSSQKEEPFIVSRYFFKILVKNERQPEILKFLRQMNIHPASLFPDLIGAALNCNKLLEERYIHKPGIVATEDSMPETGTPKRVESISDYLPGGESKPEEWAILSREELVHLLHNHGVAGAQYSALAQEILTELHPYLSQVDWQTRPAAVARLRNVTKVILRRNGYPEAARSTVINAFIFEVKNDRRPT